MIFPSRESSPSSATTSSPMPSQGFVDEFSRNLEATCRVRRGRPPRPDRHRRAAYKAEIEAEVAADLVEAGQEAAL